MKKLALLGLAVLVVGCARAPLHKGKPASHWMEQLGDPDPAVRRQAANSLAALEAKEAVPGLITALKDKDTGVRASAAEALWSIGPEAKEAVPDLIAALKDKSPEVRLNAAGALGEIGAEAKDAVPALNACLKDRDKDVHDEARKALEKIRRALKKQQAGA
jgi:HEAT repeat protein